MLDLAEKYFKITVMNMFTELRENMIKEGKKRIMTVSHQILIENINQDIYMYVCMKKNQVEILELRSTITEI